MGSKAIGPSIAQQVARETLVLEGLDCPDCASSLERAISDIDGVLNAHLNYTSSTLWVEYQIDRVGRGRIVDTINDAGYRARNNGASAEITDSRVGSRRLFSLLWRYPRAMATAGSGFLLLVGLLLSLGESPLLAQAALALGILVGGYPVARSALFSLRARQTDMNVLMTVAVLGALAIGEWLEGASVVFLFSLANALQSYTMDRTRHAIRSLLELAPKQATVLRKGHHQVVIPAEQVAVDDLILVRPGEKIATDGIVVSGRSAVNQAPVTGESAPVDKGVGDEVFAGTINQEGALKVRATRTYAENTISRIIHLVEQAQAQKAPTQQFVDRFARYYTPAVIALAVAVAVAPPLLFGASFENWFYRALTLLIIACPCALVISTPVSIAGAIAAATKHGVLFKGGAYLESMGGISVVAFDKTGTLTRGRPDVAEVVPLGGYDRQQALTMAAALEAHSEHPLARAVLRRAREEGIEILEVQEFRALPGLGAAGTVEGQSCFVGNARLAELQIGHNIDIPPDLDRLEKKGNTVVLLGCAGRLVALIAVADRLRKESKEAVNALKESGISHVVLLTGDNSRTAAAIAQQVGADDYQAELLPEDKLSAVERLLDRYGNVAMVGDGVNDAPALARATVGIAMGAAGTDTALETADVALMGDDLSKLPYMVKLSRRTVGIIRQNVAFSVAVKLLFVALASLGVANLWMAVLADVGTSLLVIANGMRLLGTRFAWETGGR
ncbi:MAG: heavy metal translocating P-type ATPase [Chloroflexota bacterium]|jgi:Cd2+/Zn2+-exporting ATPase